MEKAKITIKMEIFLRENTIKVNLMVKDFTFGRIRIVNIEENLGWE